MKFIRLFMLFFLPGFLYAADSADISVVKPPVLKGYKKLLYKVVLLHPEMSSGIEKDLLKHYLLGSGSTYQLADSDFVRLKKTVPGYTPGRESLVPGSGNEQYCIRRIDLNADAYFGWALGNINGIYQNDTDELISFADVYDFNKAKRGVRKRKQELLTRVFKFFAPSSARAFVVTYHADGFLVKP